MTTLLRRWLALASLSLLASTALAANSLVVMETSQGTIEIETLDEKAPVTVKNFLDYVDSGFYNGTIFHRVISQFVIQGGGYEKAMIRKEPRAAIINESHNGERNLRGTLSMARLSDPDSATSQFFINLRNNSSLDQQGGRPGYAVFGKVSQGMEVVESIASQATTRVGPYEDVPVEAILIHKAYIKTQGSALAKPSAPAGQTEPLTP